jgi:tetratricopeptide (TPR) repeat protein
MALIGDSATPVDEFTLKKILREAQTELPKVRGSGLANEIYLVIARAKFRLGLAAEAAEAFRNAQNLGAGIDALLHEGVSWAAAGDPEKAYPLLAKYVREMPDDLTGLVNLAEVLYRLGLREQAHSLFRDAIQLAEAREESETSASTYLLMANQAAELDLVFETKSYWDRASALLAPESMERSLAEPYRVKLRTVLAQLPLIQPKLNQLRSTLEQHAFVDSDEHATEACATLDSMRPAIAQAVRGAHDGG